MKIINSIKLESRNTFDPTKPYVEVCLFYVFWVFLLPTVVDWQLCMPVSRVPVSSGHTFISTELISKPLAAGLILSPNQGR